MKKEQSYYSKFKKPTPPKREVVQTESVGQEMIRTRFRTK